MDPNYRATDENWRDVKAFASYTRACLLELRARVEALEAAQQPAPPEPAEGLVERVAEAMERHHVTGAIEGSWDAQARAAIREVGGWLRSQLISRAAADRLEQEAER